VGERTDFQYYYGFLCRTVQKLAADYDMPEAWKAVVYSGYAPGSSLGQWVAKQPQSYELLLPWVEDKDFRRRHFSLEMLGQICAANAGLRPKILPLLREKASSADTWTQQGAMVALGTCGTAEDIIRLRNMPACSNRWGTALLCKQIENKISRCLAESPEK
jgi:hypothetical protein